MEDVLLSRKRASEEAEVPEVPMLEHADESEMCICKMAVILMSLAVAPANSKRAGIVLERQIWRYNCRHGFRARTCKRTR